MEKYVVIKLSDNNFNNARIRNYLESYVEPLGGTIIYNPVDTLYAVDKIDTMMLTNLRKDEEFQKHIRKGIAVEIGMSALEKGLIKFSESKNKPFETEISGALEVLDLNLL